MPYPTRPTRLRLPAFHPVPVRTRADGWVPWRQAEFIGMLAETGSVAAAAAFVGMARETAYRLRRKPGADEFAQAWDMALVIAGVRRPGEEPRTPRPRKVTHAPTWRTIVDGRWQPVLRHGKYAGSVRKADNSALLGHLAQLDRALRAERKALRREQRSQAETRASASTCSGSRPSCSPREGLDPLARESLAGSRVGRADGRASQPPARALQPPAEDRQC